MGRCLCGAVRYRAEAELSWMMHCHCSMCRKLHGAAFGTYLASPDITWIAGEASTRSFPSSPGNDRRFCGTCGSKTPTTAPDNAFFVPAANLTDDPGIRPEMHIFAASKAPWYEITDGIVQFAEYPDGTDAKPEIRPARPAATEGAIGGSCLCGAVRYEYTGSPLFMMNCHCSRCRLGRSAAHATNVFVAAGQFRWTSGKEKVTVYDLPGAVRFGINFCATCGGGVPRESKGTGRWVIPAGSLDSDPGIRPVGHIFVASKAPWFDITDSRPQHLEAAP